MTVTARMTDAGEAREWGRRHWVWVFDGGGGSRGYSNDDVFRWYCTALTEP